MKIEIISSVVKFMRGNSNPEEKSEGISAISLRIIFEFLFEK